MFHAIHGTYLHYKMAHHLSEICFPSADCTIPDNPHPRQCCRNIQPGCRFSSWFGNSLTAVSTASALTQSPCILSLSTSSWELWQGPCKWKLELRELEDLVPHCSVPGQSWVGPGQTETQVYDHSFFANKHLIFEVKSALNNDWNSATYLGQSLISQATV